MEGGFRGTTHAFQRKCNLALEGRTSRVGSTGRTVNPVESGGDEGARSCREVQNFYPDPEDTNKNTLVFPGSRVVNYSLSFLIFIF